MGENIRHQRSCFLAPGVESLRSVGDRLHGRFQCRIEHVIAFLAEAMGLHAAAKQIEAEIEVSGIVGVIPKECQGGCPEPVRRRPRARNGTSDGLAEIGQRFAKNLGVYRFLGFEVKIEGRGRVAGRGRDRPQ